MNYSRSLVVGSCCRSQSIAANRSAAAATTRNMATTPDRSRCEYCVAIHTFHTRSCSSRSYYLADKPVVMSSRNASLIHNSSQSCNLTAIHQECATVDALLATTADCFLRAIDRSTITELSTLIV